MAQGKTALAKKSATLLKNTTALGNKRKTPAHPFDAPEPASKKAIAKNSGRSKSSGKSVKNGDGVPFSIEYPLAPTTEMNHLKINAFVERSSPRGTTQELSIGYAVRPGKKWQEMKSYKNIKLHESTLQPGQVVYIAKTNPLPEPPADDASMGESLAYDKRNYWIAQISECRAEDGSHVYLKIFWLYWPEELPMGRQPYHGRNEVILSNALEIIDAATIVEPVSVEYWSESDQDEKLGYLFWRQTLDLEDRRTIKAKKRTAKPRGKLGGIREHCACRRPYNPDATMYLCPDQECKTWNHEQCLKDYILSETFDKFSCGELHQKRPLVDHHDSNDPEQTVDDGDTISVTPQNLMKKIGKLFHGKTGAPADEGIGTEKSKAADPEIAIVKFRGPFIPPESDKQRPWLRRFSAAIEIEEYDGEDAGRGEGSVVATVTDERKKAEVKQWKEALCCLKCGTMLE